MDNNLSGAPPHTHTTTTTTTTMHNCGRAKCGWLLHNSLKTNARHQLMLSGEFFRGVGQTFWHGLKIGKSVVGRKKKVGRASWFCKTLTASKKILTPTTFFFSLDNTFAYLQAGSGRSPDAFKKSYQPPTNASQIPTTWSVVGRFFLARRQIVVTQLEDREKCCRTKKKMSSALGFFLTPSTFCKTLSGKFSTLLCKRSDTA